MGNRIEFTKKAREDLKESVLYYEEKEVGVGKQFLEEIKNKNESIKEKPDKNPADSDGVRKTKLKKFPFYIHYVFKAPLILIIAIWHTARRPFSKKERLKEDTNESY